MPRIKLLDNASASGDPIGVPAGRYVYGVAGTFNGATVSLLLLSPDGTNFLSAGDDAALTAAGFVEVALSNTTVKADVSGGSPSGLHATLDKID